MMKHNKFFFFFAIAQFLSFAAICQTQYNFSSFFDNYLKRDSAKQVYDQAKDFTQLRDGSYFFSAISVKLDEVDTLGYATTYLTFWRVTPTGTLSKLSVYRKKNFSVNSVWVEKFNDSNYLFLGREFDLVQYDKDTIGSRLLLVKVKYNGDTIWTKTINFSDGDEIPNKIIKTRDGGFAIVGQSCDKLETNCDMFLLKLDSNANEQWHKTYAWDTDSWEYPSSVIETQNGDYILLAGIVKTTNNDTLSPLIIKTNNQGTILWKKKENTQNYSYAYFDDVVEWNNSTLLLCGSIGNSSGTLSFTKGWLMKIDTAGNSELVSKIGQENQYMGFYNIIKQKDKIIVQGESDNFGVAGSKARPVLYSLDSNFNINFARVYADSLNPTQTYIIYRLKPTSDGGFAMVGFGDDPKRVGNNQDVWFLKVDSNGCLYQPCLSVGVEQEKQEAQIDVLIYPQPALDKFQIKTDFEYEKVELLQMNGQVIFDWSFSQVYYLPLVSPGMYVIQLTSKEGRKVTAKLTIGL